MISPYLRNAICLLATAGVLIIAPVARGDDIATVYQYELRFGGRQPTGTFYLSYQSTGADRAVASGAGVRSSIRMPLYSTDSALPTAFRELSTVVRLASPTDTNPKPSPKASVGELVVAMVGLACLLAPVYAIVKDADKLVDPVDPTFGTGTTSPDSDESKSRTPATKQ